MTTVLAATITVQPFPCRYCICFDRNFIAFFQFYIYSILYEIINISVQHTYAHFQIVFLFCAEGNNYMFVYSFIPLFPQNFEREKNNVCERSLCGRIDFYLLSLIYWFMPFDFQHVPVLIPICPMNNPCSSSCSLNNWRIFSFLLVMYCMSYQQCDANLLESYTLHYAIFATHMLPERSAA